MKWYIVYYTLSDCTTSIVIDADSEDAALDQVKLRDDFDMLVSISQVQQWTP